MLEKTYNRFSDYMVSFLSLLKVIFRSNKLLDSYKTKRKRVVILGNGPSLNDALNKYSNSLKNNSLLCVNKFPSTKYFSELKPRYFLIVSRGYFIPEKVTKIQETRNNVIKDLIEKTNWPLVFFCPSEAMRNKGFIRQFDKNKNITLRFFNMTPVEGNLSIARYMIAKGWGMPRPHNVLIPSLITMINSGYKQIILLGADHSWLPLISVDDNNRTLINQKHFYDENDSKSDVMYTGTTPRKLHEILEKFFLSFKAYFVIENYAKSRHVQIVNATKGSFIDAFERREIEDILE